VAPRAESTRRRVCAGLVQIFLAVDCPDLPRVSRNWSAGSPALIGPPGAGSSPGPTSAAQRARSGRMWPFLLGLGAVLQQRRAETSKVPHGRTPGFSAPTMRCISCSRQPGPPAATAPPPGAVFSRPKSGARHRPFVGHGAVRRACRPRSSASRGPDHRRLAGRASGDLGNGLRATSARSARKGVPIGKTAKVPASRTLPNISLFFNMLR